MIEIKILAILSLIYIFLLSTITIINFLSPKNSITKLLHKKLDMKYRSVLMYCLIISLIGTISSLYLSEIKGLEPCKYCWFERIFLFPLVIIYFMSWWKKDINGIIISIPFIIIGIFISLYHYSIQVFPVEESCEIINCSSPYIWELGFISIPLMAFFNFFGLLLIVINFKILSK
jgi:disulfide bond formation protein DsbB|tara:strand:- start:8587 stop:9111 length:525 start_codon:yes stop_codon:yes gene_type:complete